MEVANEGSAHGQPWCSGRCCLLTLCSECVPANTLKKAVGLPSSYAKIRKINVNAPKTQVIALKVIKCYSLPCTIKFWLESYIERHRFQTRSCPGTQHCKTVEKTKQSARGGLLREHKEQVQGRQHCVILAYFFLDTFIVFPEKHTSLQTEISVKTKAKCKDNH